MSDLIKLPNIGKTLAQKLNAVGINSAEELKQLGSKEAFLWIRMKDLDGCYSMLCALEGAIAGVRWHYLAEEVKTDLKQYYEDLAE